MTTKRLPAGLKCLHTFRIENIVSEISWSPSGTLIAVALYNGLIKIYSFDENESKFIRNLSGHKGAVNSLSWSRDGDHLVSCSDDYGIIIWNAKTGHKDKIITEFQCRITSITWSAADSLIACGTSEGGIYIINPSSYTVNLINTPRSDKIPKSITLSPDGKELIVGYSTGEIEFWINNSISNGDIYDFLEIKYTLRHKIRVHQGPICNIVYSHNKQLLATGSTDHFITIWDIKKHKAIGILMGHDGENFGVSFSFDDTLLATKSNDNTVRLWSIDEKEFEFQEKAKLIQSSSRSINGVCFHPSKYLFASLDEFDRTLKIWRFDYNKLLDVESDVTHIKYKCAKVVVMGDASVGKTAICNRLLGHGFDHTSPTPGKRVKTLGIGPPAKIQDGDELREILLWDLGGGDPHFRLIHQLNLNEAAVAFVVFDAHSYRNDPKGVEHWNRAIETSKKLAGTSAILSKKYLLLGRSELAKPPVQKSLLEQSALQMGFEKYIETSAKRNEGIDQILKIIHDSIDWQELPRITSTKLFQDIKDFLTKLKKQGFIVTNVDNLFNLFKSEVQKKYKTVELYQEFLNCIIYMEYQHLLRRFMFGDLILLQPEVLDILASKMIDAAMTDPNGEGTIREDESLESILNMGEDPILSKVKNEVPLIIATKKELLDHEIALREETDQGAFLIFPSAFTREWPFISEPEGITVVFRFEGTIMLIYASLAVRLSRSQIFTKKDLWKNAAEYNAKAGGTCGILLQEIGPTTGQIKLFFDDKANDTTRFHFEDFVKTHLIRRALDGTVEIERYFECPKCRTPFTRQQIKRRKEKFDWIICAVCPDEVKVSLLTPKEILGIDIEKVVLEMNLSADQHREFEAAKAVLEGKRDSNDFDVFLSYNHNDVRLVTKIANELKIFGILPWLDEWEIRPGLPWDEDVEKQIPKIKAAAIFFGKSGLGHTHSREYRAFMNENRRRGIPVIPVILPNVMNDPQIPNLLQDYMLVDFRIKEPDPLKKLIYGITGKRM